MKSLWNDNEAKSFQDDPLKLRVYTSQLLGREPNLVLHGGGNTSVKKSIKNLFGETEEVLFVKGSGWDLATIEEEGFAPVKMDVLLKMAKLEQMSDTEMVRGQRAAMTNPYAPNPSVEAILHAIIPFKFVDHTHADAVVAITNTNNGQQRVQEIYGDRVLIIPYVMPGFILARKVYEMTRDVDWSQLEGMILLNHGVFTFDDDAKASYEKMIKLVTEAEEYLNKQATVPQSDNVQPKENLIELAQLRRAVSLVRGRSVLASLNTNVPNVQFANLSNVSSIATRGPLTPDHVIRTKRIPLIINGAAEKKIKEYIGEYEKYFKKYTDGQQVCLDSAPRWAVWPGHGTISFGSTIKEAKIISHIAEHTIFAIKSAEALGGWKALPEKDIFDVEYWELEQAKLKKAGSVPALQGKIALVTGAASGIGRASVQSLSAQGAVVAALDINPEVQTLFDNESISGMVCDVTNLESLEKAIASVVRLFGGLDIIVSNAGTFPPSERIEEMKPETWKKSIEINLSSHQNLLKATIPYLTFGNDPSIVIVASKNVPAPGPGVSAYSVAKAGLTQLARVAALELAEKGIRVNVVHPNAVFDTALWTEEVLEKRAKHYGMTVDEYKKSNLLKVEVTSKDVADLVCAMAGPVFSKTTGSQVPVDGGNERVI